MRQIKLMGKPAVATLMPQSPVGHVPMNVDAPAASRPSFRSVGGNQVRLFGLSPAERARRFALKAGMRSGLAGPPVVLANLDYACVGENLRSRT